MINPLIEANQKYIVDTGSVFQSLSLNFKDFDRHFILDTIKPALESILISNKIYSVASDGTNSDYLNNYQEGRYPKDLALANSTGHFPMPEYFLIPNGDSIQMTLIEYASSFRLHKSDEAHYDLFFSLQLYFTDIMEIDEFLQYHCKTTFEKDTLAFKFFIEKICIKYKTFLEYKHVPLVKHFLEQQNANTELKENHKDFTIARQVLAISYLLEEIGISNANTDRTEIARFIQFLTGKQTNASNIKNTDIYKRLGSPLNHSDSRTISDLRFIREYFEKLGSQRIVDKINKTFNK